MEDMDRVLVYRNLLAAEDHIDELLDSGELTDEEELNLEGILGEIIHVRDSIMPKEVNSHYHCAAKHLSVAYEGCREVWKVTRSSDDRILQSMVHECLNAVLEKLWGRKLVTCERCGVKEEDGRVQAEAGNGDADSVVGGDTGTAIQGISSN